MFLRKLYSFLNIVMNHGLLLTKQLVLRNFGSLEGKKLQMRLTALNPSGYMRRNHLFLGLPGKLGGSLFPAHAVAES